MDESDQYAHSESLLEEAHGDRAIPTKSISSHEKSGATVDSSGSLPEPLLRTSIEPPGTADGRWPQSPFDYRREDTLSRAKWSVDADGNPGRRNYARAYEFQWSDIPGQQRCDRCEFSQTDGNVNDTTFEANIQQWITETRHQEAVTVRLFVSYMVNLASNPVHKLSLTRGAFEAIEEDFGLHSATVRLFLDRHDASGLDFAQTGQNKPMTSADDVWLVSHFEPVSSENLVMSLKYNHQRQHTDAIIFMTANGEWLFDDVLNELLMLHECWKQFQVLPQIFRRAYLNAYQENAGTWYRNVSEIEFKLGATRIWEDGGKIVDEWPHNIDVRQNTADLHEVLYALTVDDNRLQKIKQMQRELKKIESCLENTQTIALGPSTGAYILVEYSAWTDALLQRTEALLAENQARARIQADLLFSMVSQKDSREAISMAQSAFVFTFITALFLPCTVVASIFSMSMFDWQPETESGSYVSDKFWIYWAFSVPLTIIVMGGWYWWSLKGMKLWNRSSSKDNEDAQGWRAKSRWVRFLGKRLKTKNA